VVASYKASTGDDKTLLLDLLAKVVQFNQSLHPLPERVQQLCFRDEELVRRMGFAREDTIVKAVQVVRWQLVAEFSN
jgi:hypothetical protein